MYIANWQEFQEAAEALYERSPATTRYCVKWRAAEGILVLKITDNMTCLKYKTHSSIFLNRFETLNLSLMRRMQNRKLLSTQPEKSQLTSPEDALKTPASGIGVPHSTGSSVVPVTAGPTGGGVKKKKGKKKK